MSLHTIVNPKTLGIIAAVIAVSISLIIIQNGDAQNTVYAGPKKAVIIDQLYDDIPNEYFLLKAAEYLVQAGYAVDVFTTEKVTVDFFKHLPEQNYNFIIVRTHGAADVSDDNVVTLFTGERYTEDKYIQEQLFGQVKKGAPFAEVNFRLGKHTSSDWVQLNDTAITITTPAIRETTSEDNYFLIPPKLVYDSMVGKFPSSIIILGGCNTMTNPSMAKALVARGASIVIGWDDAVGSEDNDDTLLKVLEKTLKDNQKIEDAVDSVLEEREWFNQYYPANLRYYTESGI